ncbi:alpha/beta fold hydrolase [Streptosporangium roseum]|uniref:alpha/beta fold hydrolase n=1 Tax=Streptosporangium roseum TaxID=2001 RepID=UPI003320AEC2
MSMQTVVSADGTAIAYDTYGAGPAVVLVGGAFQTRDDPKFVHLAELLATSSTVYSYDRRGRGDSGDAGSYTTGREVEDIAAILTAAGGEAMLFGMSSGAVLALDAAAALPISKIAVYEPPFIVDDSRPPLPADYVATLDVLIAGGRQGDAAAYFMTQAAGVPAEYVDGMRQAPFFAAMEAVAHTLGYDGRIMGETMSGRPLPAERFGAIGVPALIVDGGASVPHFASAADALAGLLPTSVRTTLEGQDHDVDPALLAPVLSRFFA